MVESVQKKHGAFGSSNSLFAVGANLTVSIEADDEKMCPKIFEFLIFNNEKWQKNVQKN